MAFMDCLDGVPVLGPVASSGYFNIGNTISLVGSPTLYLNLANNTSPSYQALSFNTTAITADWGLEGQLLKTHMLSLFTFI